MNVWKISGISVLLFLGINYLRPIFTSLSYLQNGFGVFLNEFSEAATSGRYAMNGILDVFTKLSYYLEHKYVSLEVAISAVNSGLHHKNYFYEIFIAIIGIIPSSLLFFEKPDSIIFYNTYYITGIYESKIPPGGVALGYYSMSLLGVVLFSWLFGILGKKINNYFYNLDSIATNYLYVATMFFWIDIYICGDLRQTFQRFFVFIIILIYLKIKTKKIIHK